MFVISRLVAAVVGVLLVAALVWWMRRHPNRAEEYPDRQRMPKIVPFLGWLLTVVGLLMSFVAFTSDDANDPLAFRIASIAILFGGVLFVMMYRNFYVAPGADDVHFRTVLGREDRIAYGDIADWRIREQYGQPYLTVRSGSGVKLSLNSAIYDLSPLHAARAFQQAHGRWPMPGEPR